MQRTEQKKLFNMIFPRQKLYNVELFKVFFLTLIKFNKGFAKSIYIIRDLLNLTKNEHLALTPYARVGIHLVLSYVISNYKKKDVLLSPFTIRDMENMIISAGGNPIYIDHSNDSTDLDYELIKNYLKDNHETVGALILTHFVVINPEIEKIIRLCRKYKIFLVQDCAIIFGATFKKIPIYKYGDASVLSFNMFKFVSSIHGGAVITKDKNLISYIEATQKNWQTFSAKDLTRYFFKGSLFRFITNKFIFNLISFNLIAYAEKYSIRFLKNFLVNNPTVSVKKTLPYNYKRQLNEFQVRSIASQIPLLEENTQKRKRNFLFLEKYITNPAVKKLVTVNNLCDGGFINFPVLVEDRASFSKHLYNNRIDHSCFFYPNITKNSKKDICKNVTSVSDRIVFFPIHPQIQRAQLQIIVRHVNSYQV